MAEALPIAYPGFEGRGLALRPMGFFQGAAIICDGAAAPRKGRTFTLTDNHGAPVSFRLNGNVFDPIPAVVVGGKTTLRLGRPFAWYEYLWIALPLVLFVGGALGGLCGGVAVLVNARLLRSSLPVLARYGLGVLVILGAAVAWLVLAVALTFAVGGLPRQG